MTELHLKYAPILRFAAPTGSTERFYPMRVEDYIAYSALYAKGQGAPLLPRGQVTPDRLADKLADAGTFLRSVDTGPKTGVGQREIELPGVSAPHGPMIGDTGEKRPQWAGPVEWAGVPPA